ncbi:hypothetical protein FG379_001222 [Cryptosporidium bovis]|uniref:uncharacterized protein n=1 Tax=Cryptosporidium bovis TaxID=310047 RepID=UPI00351A3C47|nr:hypothetical protein FG379_001222 [Cryptosporidium bovis]
MESSKFRRLLDYLEYEKRRCDENQNAKICMSDQNQHSSVVYRYENTGNSGYIPVTVASAVYMGDKCNHYDEKDCLDDLGVTRNEKSMGCKVKNDYPKVEVETLLILQEVTASKEYGKGETTYFGNEFKDKKLNIKESQLDDLENSSEEDIFSDIEISSKSSSKNRRNRSFERSITPDLDTFIDEIYGFEKQDVINDDGVVNEYKSDQDGSTVNVTDERDSHILSNKNHISTAEYLSKFGKKKGGLGRKGLEKNKIDYSLFSRTRSGNYPGTDNTKTSRSEKSNVGFEPSSSHQPYSECYLEVDGVCYLETHQDEDEEIKREIEKERYRDKMEDKKKDHEKNNKKQKKSCEKLLNREWKSIQRIMKKGDFRPLDIIGGNM